MNRNAQLEQNIVSTILKYPEVLAKTHIESRWFNEYKKVIVAYQLMQKEGVDIDPLSLSDYLVGSYSLQEIGYWHLHGVGTPSSFNHFIEKLRSIYHAAESIRTIETAIGDIKESNDVSGSIANMMQKISDIENIDSANYNHDMKQGLNLFVEKLEYDFDNENDRGLKLGFTLVDDALGGLHKSDLMIIGARPAAGKTAMALSIILEVAKAGKKIGFISTEMSVTQVMGRLVSMVSGIPTTRIRDASLEDDHWPRISAATQLLKDLDIRIYDKPNMTAGGVMVQSRAWAINGGIDLIVVDYLTRLKADNPSGNQNLDVGDIATTMKNIARLLNVPVIVLAQLNRGSENRSDRRPRMADLRDSGVIEQEADQILLLYRPEVDGDSKNTDGYSGDEIIIDKNRHGQTGITRAHFHKETAMWKSSADSHDY